MGTNIGCGWEDIYVMSLCDVLEKLHCWEETRRIQQVIGKRVREAYFILSSQCGNALSSEQLWIKTCGYAVSGGKTSREDAKSKQEKTKQKVYRRTSKRTGEI